jgi:hypothetical protein
MIAIPDRAAERESISAVAAREWIPARLMPQATG